jgi:hypothetical protein
LYGAEAYPSVQRHAHKGDVVLDTSIYFQVLGLDLLRAATLVLVTDDAAAKNCIERPGDDNALFLA